MTSKIPMKPKVIGYCNPVCNDPANERSNSDKNANTTSSNALLSPGFSDRGKAATDRIQGQAGDKSKRGSKRNQRNSSYSSLTTTDLKSHQMSSNSSSDTNGTLALPRNMNFL